MAAVTTMTAKSQVTFPRAVRQGLQAQVRALFVCIAPADGAFRVRAVPPGLSEALRLTGQEFSPDDGMFGKGIMRVPQGWTMPSAELSPRASASHACGCNPVT